MDDTKRLIWSCTKFLATLLCALSSAVWWLLGSGGVELFVIMGYLALILGIVGACLTYMTEISPALKQEKIDNKD